MADAARKLSEQIRSYKCSRKGCLSQQRDHIEVAWFGTQYGDNKEFTCSACFLCHDESMRNAYPASINILPLTLFVEKFAIEWKTYEQNKSSKDFFPKLMRERAKQIAIQMQRVEVEVTERLTQLLNALAGFLKKVEQANGAIFKHPIFEQIIQMNNEGKLEGLLEKILQLITLLNDYRFEDLEQREKKLGKLSQAISEISQKTVEVLKELYESIKEKNQLISKL